MNDRDKNQKRTRKNFTGPQMPFQQFIEKRRTEMGIPLRQLHRDVCDILPEDIKLPLSTFWEWANRSHKHVKSIRPEILKAVAAILKTPFDDLAKLWDISRVQFAEQTIPTPLPQRSGLEILIATLESNNRKYINRETILELAKRLNKTS